MPAAEVDLHAREAAVTVRPIVVQVRWQFGQGWYSARGEAV